METTAHNLTCITVSLVVPNIFLLTYTLPLTTGQTRSSIRSISRAVAYLTAVDNF